MLSVCMASLHCLASVRLYSNECHPQNNEGTQHEQENMREGNKSRHLHSCGRTQVCVFAPTNQIATLAHIDQSDGGKVGQQQDTYSSSVPGMVVRSRGRTDEQTDSAIKSLGVSAILRNSPPVTVNVKSPNSLRQHPPPIPLGRVNRVAYGPLFGHVWAEYQARNKKTSRRTWKEKRH